MSSVRATLPAILATMIAGWIGSAAAAPGAKGDATAALTAACSGDLATFCPDVDPGGKAVEECFRRHMKELSPACGKAVAEHKAEAQSERR